MHVYCGANRCHCMTVPALGDIPRHAGQHTSFRKLHCVWIPFPQIGKHCVCFSASYVTVIPCVGNIFVLGSAPFHLCVGEEGEEAGEKGESEEVRTRGSQSARTHNRVRGRVLSYVRACVRADIVSVETPYASVSMLLKEIAPISCGQDIYIPRRCRHPCMRSIRCSPI